MFEYLDISKAPPRSIQDIKAYLNTGIRLYRAFGLFFMIQSILLFVFVVISTKRFFPSIVILVFTFIGYLLLRKYSQKLNARQEIYQHGTPINAQVVNHGRQMSLIKSKRDYAVYVQVEGHKTYINIVHPSKALWAGAPIGSHIIGLTHKGKHLFAEEMGCRFRIVSAQ